MAQDADSPLVSQTAIARPRLREQLREAIRRRNYSRRTEQTYWFWIRWFIRHNGVRHPAQMGAAEVEAFLSWLATERNVAAATQNQALSALLFLYKQLLGQDLPWFKDLVRAKRPVRVPAVLSRSEAQRLLAQMQGTKWLMASLLYGAGLRQIECLQLRVKDVDFAYRQVLVRDAKGAKDRVTMLPEQAVQPLQAHLARVRALHQRDLAAGHGEVSLPYALARKYPRAGYEWSWQFVFPSGVLSADPESGVIRRHHVFPDTLGRAVKARGACGPHRQAGELPYLAALLRDAPARIPLRHPHRAGAARPQRRQHDDDLHARTQQGWPRRGEPAGSDRANTEPVWTHLSACRNASWSCAASA